MARLYLAVCIWALSLPGCSLFRSWPKQDFFVLFSTQARLSFSDPNRSFMQAAAMPEGRRASKIRQCHFRPIYAWGIAAWWRDVDGFCRRTSGRRRATGIPKLYAAGPLATADRKQLRRGAIDRAEIRGPLCGELVPGITWHQRQDTFK